MIIIFTQYFKPAKKAGGPITSISNMIEQLDLDFNVMARGHDLNDTVLLPVELNKWTSNNSRWYVGFGLKSLIDLIYEIRKLRKHIFYVNGLFDIKLNLLPIIFGKKLIIAPRGMLQKGALQYGQVKKQIYLGLLKLVIKKKWVKWHATDLVEAADIKINFGKQKIETVANLITVPNYVGFKSSKEQKQLRLVYFSLIAEKKNLLFLLQTISRIEADISLDIFGPVKDLNYFERCRTFIDQHPKLLEKVCFKGLTEANFMQSHAAEYDYFVLPTKGENFGHAIVESLANGLPVLISNSTPWQFNDNPNFGSYAIPLNEKLWQKTLEELVKQDKVNHSIAKQSAYRFFYEKIASRNHDSTQGYFRLFEN